MISPWHKSNNPCLNKSGDSLSNLPLNNSLVCHTCRQDPCTTIKLIYHNDNTRFVTICQLKICIGLNINVNGNMITFQFAFTITPSRLTSTVPTYIMVGWRGSRYGVFNNAWKIMYRNYQLSHNYLLVYWGSLTQHGLIKIRECRRNNTNCFLWVVITKPWHNLNDDFTEPTFVHGRVVKPFFHVCSYISIPWSRWWFGWYRFVKYPL